MSVAVLITLLTAFGSCILGKICGMGGGVIIKPVLDALGVLSVSAINFLSSCTVLGMSSWSVFQCIRRKETAIDFSVSTPLAVGAVVGGAAGKKLYSLMECSFASSDTAGGIQAIILCVATFLTLLYTINQNRISSKHVKNKIACVIIGLLLGMLGSFLGIGGGPFNVAVLYYFFSMSAKTAAQNSLYIIMFSQIAGIAITIFTTGAPSVSFITLFAMIGCGILGSESGSRLNRRISDAAVTRCFQVVMAVIIFINIYNIWKYL